MNERNEDHLNYRKTKKNELWKISVQKLEQSFSTMFEDIKDELRLILILSITDPDKLKQSQFTAHWIKIIKILALEKKQTENIERIRCCNSIRIVFSVH